MNVTHNRDRTIEVVIYETDRLIVAFNRAGTCIGRITVLPETLTGPYFQIEILPKKPKGS